MPITKEEFWAYEEIRRSGVTNMFDIVAVSRLSGLDRKTVLEIHKHYSALKAEYMKGKEDEEV
jgi:hypothetical protein